MNTLFNVQLEGLSGLGVLQKEAEHLLDKVVEGGDLGSQIRNEAGIQTTKEEEELAVGLF